MADRVYLKSRALFIRRWGEMAANWGISRTMAEIHAMLFVSTDPLCADDLMAELQVSRGSVSMNLRDLLNWGLIHRVHERGDRKDYYVGESDVWQMFEIIMRERRRREIEPLIETIEKCRTMLQEAPKERHRTRRGAIREYEHRLSDMQEFFAAMNTLFNLLVKLGRPGVGKLRTVLAKLGG